MTMVIELLYIRECPNSSRAFHLLSDILRKHSFTTDIRRIEIHTEEEAVTNKFIGSPTIRIDGRDVDPSPGDETYAVTCRVYSADGKFSGLPSAENIERALFHQREIL